MTTTEVITRGTVRLLHAMGYAALCEFPLSNGRRADVVGVQKSGRIIIAEVKSCLSDFRADRKWQEYLPFSDEFYFAVDAEFPVEVLSEDASLPDVTGIIVADGYGGDIVRPAAERALHPVRRRTVHLKMARVGADRLTRPFVASVHARQQPGL